MAFMHIIAAQQAQLNEKAKKEQEKAFYNQDSERAFQTLWEMHREELETMFPQAAYNFHEGTLDILVGYGDIVHCFRMTNEHILIDGKDAGRIEYGNVSQRDNLLSMRFHDFVELSFDINRYNDWKERTEPVYSDEI